MNQDILEILLVEDDPAHAQLVLRAFENRPGVRLTVAHSLQQARRHLAGLLPDLVILDLLLPDGRGIELLAECRQNGSLFPAVVMTSHGDEAVAVEAMKAGALDYLVKSEETFAQMPHFAARALREWHHIHERRVAEERLRETNRELEAFVYTISHDLRAPLTPIIGYSEFLRSEYGSRLDPLALDSLTEIENSAHRMTALLEDLLALAKAGYLERPQEAVESAEVLREVLQDLASQWPAAVVEVVEPLPPVHLPQTQLAQIFQNLIGNALRYAGPAVAIGGAREADRVCFFVRDHGPGIPPTERDRIFEVFYRGSTAGANRGTGIGLATVRKIARSYGGRVWVEDTPGGGSTFRVLLQDRPAVRPSAWNPGEKRFLLEVYGEYCEIP